MSNLHNNIDRIAAAFSDIKDAIEKQGGTVTECTPPEAYGDAIRALQPSIGGGGSCKCDLTPYAKTVDVDAKDASTLAAAKTYADNILRSDPGSSVTTAYVDERDRATLTEAKNYTDSKVAGVIGDATKAAENKVKEMIDESGGGATYAYVDEHDAATLASALAADAEVLDEAKEYADSIQPDVIDTIDKNSNALVTSRAIANALDTKQPALTGSTELFTLQQGDNPRIHVHYLDDITIDAGGNATIIQGEIYLVLTNDTKFMGVGSDGIYDGNAFTFVTGVQMKYGGENMTIKNVTWTSSNPKITGVWNKNNSTITWTVPDKTDLNQTADIKVTATGTNSIFGTANEKTAEGVVQVVGVKSAEDGVSYDLDLNYGYVLGRLQSDGKTYKYTPNGADAPLLAKAYKDLGGTRTPIGGGDYRITYGFDAATPIAATSYNDATKTYELAIGTPSSDNKFLHVYLYENNVMWDHETLAIVRDGQKGEDAESTTELVIINDTKYIGTGDDYTYNGNPLQFESEVYLQYGGERLSPTGTGLTIASASGVSANTT